MSTSIVFVSLDYVGHGGKTAVLDGGVTAWREAGGTMSKEAVDAKPVTFVPTVRNDMVVNATWVKENLEARRRCSMCGRAPSTTARPTSACLGRGTSRGRSFVPWLATFDARDVPRDASGDPVDNMVDAARLLPRAELEQLLTAAGAKRDGLVVSYCTVGMRASHMYFVSRLLGYPSRIYVGSMADWTRNPDNPVVGQSNKP